MSSASSSSSTAAQSDTKVEEAKEVKPGPRLYVRWDFTDEMFQKHFEQFGTVKEARVVRGPRNRSFGFITFESEKEAKKALEALTNKTLATSPLTIEYASSEKKERRPRETTGGDAAKGGRGAKGGSQGGSGGASSASSSGGSQGGATGTDGKRGGSRRGRGGRRGGKTDGGDGSSSGSGNAKSSGGDSTNNVNNNSRSNPMDQFRDDAQFGKTVILSPDPIKYPIKKDATITELTAGTRSYRSGRTDGKQVAQLLLYADPTKGPFNCKFSLGEFELKLLAVTVLSKPGDTRVACLVEHPVSTRSREVYLRVREGNKNAYKFLELRKEDNNPNDKQEKDLDAPYEAFFVTIESISLDVVSGLWKKILLSLVSLQVDPRKRETSAQRS